MPRHDQQPKHYPALQVCVLSMCARESMAEKNKQNKGLWEI